MLHWLVALSGMRGFQVFIGKTMGVLQKGPKPWIQPHSHEATPSLPHSIAQGVALVLECADRGLDRHSQLSSLPTNT